MTVCLDSWAVMGWLEDDDPGASLVDDALLAGKPWMSWINLGEVAYQLERRRDRAEATKTVERLLGLLRLDEVTGDRVLASARLKAVHPIAFADCFAAATAAARDAVLYTGDPEILERDLGCVVRDLR